MGFVVDAATANENATASKCTSVRDWAAFYRQFRHGGARTNCADPSEAGYAARPDCTEDSRERSCHAAPSTGRASRTSATWSKAHGACRAASRCDPCRANARNQTRITRDGHCDTCGAHGTRSAGR